MKTPFACSILFCAVFLGATTSIFAQGSLTPTGTPGPSMKSLDQIEARTPISSLPFIISSGGSYYLTKSLSVGSGNGITITVDNVNLDLNGFTISSTANPAAGDAILLSGGRKNARITNGNITGSVTFNGSTFSGAGFQQGIVGTTTDPIATTVSFVNISGLSGAGIYLGLGTSATLIDACNVFTVGGNGLTAVTVTNSTAAQCGLAAITGHTVMNCRGDCVGSDVGINATVAENCYAKSTNNNGIVASTAINCYGANLLGTGPTTAIGINAQTATGCQGVSTSGTGLHASYGALNCYGASTGSADGIQGGAIENCYGQSSSGTAIFGDAVTNCDAVGHTKGIQGAVVNNSVAAASSVGIGGSVVTGSYGSAGLDGTANSQGISGEVVTSSYGTATGGNSGFGIQAFMIVGSTGLGSDSSFQSQHEINCVGQ